MDCSCSFAAHFTRIFYSHSTRQDPSSRVIRGILILKNVSHFFSFIFFFRVKFQSRDVVCCSPFNPIEKGRKASLSSLFCATHSFHSRRNCFAVVCAIWDPDWIHPNNNQKDILMIKMWLWTMKFGICVFWRVRYDGWRFFHNWMKMLRKIMSHYWRSLPLPSRLFESSKIYSKFDEFPVFF